MPKPRSPRRGRRSPERSTSWRASRPKRSPPASPSEKEIAMTRKQRRLTLIGLAGIVLVIAAGLVLYALSDRIVFFNSPSDVVAKGLTPGTRIRLGGLVEEGSLVKTEGGV